MSCNVISFDTHIFIKVDAKISYMRSIHFILNFELLFPTLMIDDLFSKTTFLRLSFLFLFGWFPSSRSDWGGPLYLQVL